MCELHRVSLTEKHVSQVVDEDNEEEEEEEERDQEEEL